MFRKAFLFGGPLLPAGAAVLVTPGFGQAQHRGGGGHGGGFHGAGVHSGGSFNHGSVNHGGFNHGSFNHGGFNRGGGVWWYPGYYGSYGAWPYNYGYNPYYGNSDYYPYSYSSDWSSPAYNSGYDGSYGGVTSSYLNGYSLATVQPDPSAHITVSVPADAEILFNDIKTSVTGAVREYQSPPLTLGDRYAYEVRARWHENGREVIQKQQVEVTAGAHVSVAFPAQLTTATTAPSH